jgi:voltage-gated sodium channel
VSHARAHRFTQTISLRLSMPLLFQRIVSSNAFQRIVFAAIVLAGLLAGLETDQGFVAEHGALLRVFDLSVLTIFVVELVLKIGAHGRKPWLFFRDGWNVFDFVIVMICLLPLDAAFAAVLRLARTLRVLRLISALPRLQLLVGALFRSISAMGYVCLLLSLICYIYAVAGVHLFSVNAPTLFGSLTQAVMTLFRVMTLDNWSDSMALVQLHQPIAATLYFLSFILIGTMIMLNLFIGIVMNSMTQMHAEQEAKEQADRAPSLSDEQALGTLASELERISAQLKRLQENTKTTRPSSP